MAIATEAKVVAMLRERGIAKSSLTRDEFLGYAWEWKEKYGGIILQQLRKMGGGKITVNDREFETYFVNDTERRLVLQTLDHVGHRDKVDVFIRVNGGGTCSQAGAVRMGLARALVSLNEENFGPLRDDGYLTRDSRMKERKKYGLRGARRGVQFSKR